MVDRLFRQAAGVLILCILAALGVEARGASVADSAAPPVDAEVLADVREQLASGDSAARLKGLVGILRQPELYQAIDDSFIEGFEAAAADADAAVRAEVARVAGNRFVWGAQPQNPRIIRLMQKLASGDDDANVRSNAVYFGLSTVTAKDDETIRAMLAAAFRLAEYESNLHGRIVWGLRGETPDRLAPFFDAVFDRAEAEPDKALLAFVLYHNITGSEPPGADRLGNVGRFLVSFVTKRSGVADARPLTQAFHDVVPKEFVERVIAFRDRTETGGVAVVKGLGNRREVLRRLEASDEFRPNEQLMVVTERVLKHLDDLEARQKDGPPILAAGPGVTITYEQALKDLHETLGRTYPSFAIKGVDWKKVGEELLPRVKDVKNDEEFGLLCMELVARLEDSHAFVGPGSAKPPNIEFPRFDPGFACLLDDRGRPVVFHVDADSPAHGAGVRPGWVVASIDQVPAEQLLKQRCEELSRYSGFSSRRYLEHQAARLLARVTKQHQMILAVFDDPDGKRVELNLPASLGVRYLPRLPVPIPGVRDSADVSWTSMSDGAIGYIYVRRIRADLEKSMDAALTELGEIKGLILDVRGNTGGGFDAQTAHRHFDLNAAAESDRPRFTGPIALLLDEACISAGEGWASWFIANQRARTFGSATAGASARKTTYELTNRLYKITYPVKAYTGFLDRPIERRGLEPDVPLRPAARDLAAGKDTVLEAAKKHLMEQ